MKKYLNLAGLLVCAALILGIGSGTVFARLTGTEPGTDIWCVGPSGAEVCVDVSGNLIPTTDNDTTVGSTSLRFATVNAYDLAAGDDLTVADDATVSDDLTVTGDIFNTPTSTITVTAALSIDLAGKCGKVVLLQTDGASRVTDTTNTFTNGVVGCVYYLYHTGANGGGTITLDDNALFDVPANVVLGTGDGAIVACVAGTTKFVLLGTSDN